jgi:hypothetical protein
VGAGAEEQKEEVSYKLGEQVEYFSTTASNLDDTGIYIYWNSHINLNRNNFTEMCTVRV